MRLLQFIIAVAPFAAAFGVAKSADAQNGAKISGPVLHDNLAVYFIHGASAEGPAPLTLQEAFAKKNVHVGETGDVNELVIENLGDEEIFIQSGDIVKGGRQDRVLTTTLVLPPKSGKVPVGAFCVEQGRWSARGMESVMKFALSAESMPSRAAKLAMKAPPVATGALGDDAANIEGRLQAYSERSPSRQSEVWRSIAETQEKLSKNVGDSVAAAESASSLQLSLENEKLKKVRADYVLALEPKGAAEGDIVGYVFAVNGKISGADVYPSNALFRKMWSKMLAAGVTEAIGEKDAEKTETPSVAKVEEFLASAEKGERHENEVAKLMRIETRDATQAIYVESKGSDNRWMHRSYVAK